MLEILEFTEATLATVTTRTEKHGDEDVPAVTLGLELTVANTMLDVIDPTIRHALYRRHDGQEDLPGVEQSTPVLRCNSINRAILATKYDGWTLEVDDGIDETTPKAFGSCKVDKFTVEPKQGGSCVLRMRVGTSDLDAERSGMLGMHVGQPVWIKLRAPEKAVDEPQDDQSGEGEGEQDAGGLFIESADGQQPSSTAAAASPFVDTPSSTVVTIKRGRKGKGLGTDEEQAARQAEVLAKDSSQAWPFPDPDKAKAQTPEEAFSGTAH